MADRTALIPLSKSEFAVGKVTQRSIYDRHGKLLLATGATIETLNQLNNLFEQGYVQKNQWDELMVDSTLHVPSVTLTISLTRP